MNASINENDNMDVNYINNPDHYKTGLMSIGCSRVQALAYSKLFDVNREHYYQVVDKFIERLPSGAKICDVGMGTGNDLLYFASKHSDKKFVGVELSNATLEIAEKFFSDAKICNIEVTNNVDWHRHYKFDLIINNCVYEHVGDVEEFTEFISNALDDNGNFVFVVPSHAYSIFWNLLYFAARFIFKGKPDTHSVEHKVMLETLSNNQMMPAGRHSIGFRPPQTYFPHVSVKHIDKLKDRNENLSNIVRRIGLGSALYLNVYYGSKCAKERGTDKSIYREISDLFTSMRFEEIKVGDVFLFLSVYLKWQLIYHPLSLIKALIKRVFKYG